MNNIGTNINRWKKKKVILIITEILTALGLAVTTSTLSILNPSVGVVWISSTALLTSVAILIMYERISKIKRRFTNILDWIIVITLPYEKTLKQPMVDERIDDNKVLELKKILIHCLDKRSDNMKNMQFRFEDIFGDILSEGSIPPQQITKIIIIV